MQYCKLTTMEREVTVVIMMVLLTSGMLCAPLTSTDSSLTTATLKESTRGIFIEYYMKIIVNTKLAHRHVTNALENHCSWLNEFPSQYDKSRCLDYARDLGMTTANCTGNIPTMHVYNGSSIPIKQTTLAAVESMGFHRSLLYGILQLPDYIEAKCTTEKKNTLAYCKCRMEPTSVLLNDAIKYAKKILTDVEPPAEFFPEEITCDVDKDMNNKAPLGILWKIQADLEVIIINVRQGCEKVKLDQETTSVSCS